jgi:hypothetical protein
VVAHYYTLLLLRGTIVGVAIETSSLALNTASTRASRAGLFDHSLDHHHHHHYYHHLVSVSPPPTSAPVVLLSSLLYSTATTATTTLPLYTIIPSLLPQYNNSSLYYPLIRYVLPITVSPSLPPSHPFPPVVSPVFRVYYYLFIYYLFPIYFPGYLTAPGTPSPLPAPHSPAPFPLSIASNLPVRLDVRRPSTDNNLTATALLKALLFCSLRPLPTSTCASPNLTDYSIPLGWSFCSIGLCCCGLPHPYIEEIDK